jgi:hypothetical protein
LYNISLRPSFFLILIVINNRGFVGTFVSMFTPLDDSQPFRTWGCSLHGLCYCLCNCMGRCSSCYVKCTVVGWFYLFLSVRVYPWILCFSSYALFFWLSSMSFIYKNVRAL